MRLMRGLWWVFGVFVKVDIVAWLNVGAIFGVNLG